MKSFKPKSYLGRTTAVMGTVAALSFATAANAYDDYRDNRHNNIDYAKVVDVDPIINTYQVSEPVEKCFDERVPVYRKAHYKRKESRTPEIFGAIIGAAVGNQFGGGRGKDIATAAGAILGGSIGRDIKNDARAKHRYHNGPQGYKTVQRCEVSEVYRTQEEVVGYNVRYKYRGETYHTRMDYDPGDRIKVRVSVQPV
ncbi:MAG: glycine zipper 2TM domain-containing protein [Pseudomonadota bacterium]